MIEYVPKKSYKKLSLGINQSDLLIKIRLYIYRVNGRPVIKIHIPVGSFTIKVPRHS